MRAQKRRRLVAAPRHGGLGNRGVLVGHVPRVRPCPDDDAPVAVVEIVEHPGEAQHQRHVAAFDQREVKAAMRGLPDVERRGIAGIAPDAVDPVKCGHHAGFPIQAAILDRRLERHRLDRHPERRDLRKIRQRDRSDAVAPVLLGVDEAVGDEPRHRLAQGRDADRPALAHAVEVEALAGFERAGQNLRAQLPRQTLRQRGLASPIVRCRRIHRASSPISNDPIPRRCEDGKSFS